VLFAGERFPTKHLRELMSCVPHPRFCNMYGTTETHIAAFYDVQPIPEDSDEPLPIGRACAHVNLMAVDPQGRRVEPGATGELVVRGPSVMEGYWRQPERTSTVLVKYRFGEQLEGLCYRTGDLVQLKPDGNYYIIGRGDRRVKVRGNLVDLDEVEKALLADERVRESAVYLITEEGEALTKLGAAVVLKPGATAQPTELRHGLSLQLPAYALPNHVAIMPDLPRTGSGKISRRALQAMEAEQAAAAGAGGRQGAAQPAGIQEAVRNFVLTELLSSADGADIDDETDLLMTGLIDSLSVVRLLAFLEERYSIRVPPEQFVEENFNTLTSISRLIERLQGEGAGGGSLTR
jgi:acyl-coenzyme A synthetase/AMP-(fatty) acid ligase/acyl carrier protein